GHGPSPRSGAGPRRRRTAGARTTTGDDMPILIGDALRWHATYTPSKTAIVSPDGSASYADLWLRAIRLADGLRGLGIGSGERVAALLQNGAPYIELYHAAALLGAAVVPLNFRFVGSEIEYVMNHSGARVL